MSETPSWLRTADGRVRLNVLRAFLFNYRLSDREARPRCFEAGEHMLDPRDIDDAQFLAHPWICSTFADGCIESPDQARARLQAEAAVSAERHERQQALLRETEVFTARAVASLGSNSRSHREADDAAQRDLDTPLNQCSDDLQRQLNTPLNRL